MRWIDARLMSRRRAISEGPTAQCVYLQCPAFAAGMRPLYRPSAKSLALTRAGRAIPNFASAGSKLPPTRLPGFWVGPALAAHHRLLLPAEFEPAPQPRRLPSLAFALDASRLHSGLHEDFGSLRPQLAFSVGRPNTIAFGLKPLDLAPGTSSATERPRLARKSRRSAGKDKPLHIFQLIPSA
jgi:hypothetical protein